MSDAVMIGENGERLGYLGPDLDDPAWPAGAREALRRRRMVALGEPCPCGAVMVVPNRAARRKASRESRVLPVTVEHEDDCPALDERALRGLTWDAR